VGVEQGRRSRVAQTPDHDFPQGGGIFEKNVDSASNVGTHVFESPHPACTVPYPAIVEPQRGHAVLGEMSRKQSKLPMAPHPVLRAADDDQHASLCRKGCPAQYPDERLAATIECERDFVVCAVGHGWFDTPGILMHIAAAQIRRRLRRTTVAVLEKPQCYSMM
jgi:hypothetical protein